jgi:hypothetical protein
MGKPEIDGYLSGGIYIKTKLWRGSINLKTSHEQVVH